MRRLALALLASTALAGSAYAADIRASRAPSAAAVAPVMVGYNWTGLYVGAHIGWGWAEHDWGWTGPGPFAWGWGNGDIDGFLGGLQIGFDWQMGQWVVGLEGDVSWIAFDDDDGWWGGAANWWRSNDSTWVSTITGRLGYAFDRTLLYVKGGVAFADTDHDVWFGNTHLWGGGDTRTGYVLGAGVEWAFMPNWSLKLEYNFMDFGGDDGRFVWAGGLGIAPGTYSWDIDTHVHAVKLGVNYRFGGMGKAPAPVISKY